MSFENTPSRQLGEGSKPTYRRTDTGKLMPGFQMVRPVHLKGDRVRETSKPSYVGWSRRRAPVRADSRRQGISQQTSLRSSIRTCALCGMLMRHRYVLWVTLLWGRWGLQRARLSQRADLCSILDMNNF